MLLFNETLLNIMSNFIPNKLMIFDDKEPPWFDRKIKNLIKFKNQFYKDTYDRKSNHNFQFHFRYIQDLIITKIDQGKRTYYEYMSRQLSDKSLNPKKYWSLLKTLLNSNKKYLVYHHYTIITNLYLKLRQSMSFLIRILQNSTRPLSITASCQQDLQLIPIPF